MTALICTVGIAASVFIFALLCGWAQGDFRPGGALAAGSRRVKTPKAVECEASQSGPKGNAQKVQP